VKCSESLGNRVCKVIRRCIDHMNILLYLWFFFIYHITSCSFGSFFVILYGCLFRILMFNSVRYVLLLLLCLCILIVMYALFSIFCFNHANWHSSVILTEDFPCYFLSCKANARV